jgi:hypothetical protein
VPDLPGLSELPDEALFRYDGTLEGLRCALAEAVLAEASTLARMSAAADAFCASRSWDEIAKQTLDVMRKVLNADSNVTPKLAAHALSTRE